MRLLWGVFGRASFDAAVIACNTAHLLLEPISKLIGKRPISLIAVTKKYIHKGPYSKIGILGTPATIEHNLYGGINTRLVHLNKKEQLKTEKLIRQVIANKQSDGYKILNHQIDLLLSEGCEAVILGCSELSVLADGANSAKIIDPLSLVVPYLFQDIMEEI